MKKYIAIFVRTDIDYKYLEVFPKDLFIRIRRLEDTRGRTFSAIVRYDDWYRDSKLVEAYHSLCKRQPELYENYPD